MKIYSGAGLIVISCLLWAMDTIFRMPLLAHYSTTFIVLVEHLIAILVMFPIFALRKSDIKNIKRQDWFALAFIGIAGSAIATTLLVTSFKLLNPSVCILLQKTQPIITILGARLFLKEKLKQGFLIWALIAIVGALMVSAPELLSQDMKSFQFDGVKMIGVLCALGASFCWGMSTVFGSGLSAKIGFTTTTFFRFLWGLLPLVIIELLVPTKNLSVFENQHSISFLYIGIFSGVLAMNIYYAGLKRTTAGVAGISELSFPLFAVIVNWVFLGKTLGPVQLLGGAILIFAIFRSNTIVSKSQTV